MRDYPHTKSRVSSRMMPVEPQRHYSVSTLGFSQGNIKVLFVYLQTYELLFYSPHLQLSQNTISYVAKQIDYRNHGVL